MGQQRADTAPSASTPHGSCCEAVNQCSAPIAFSRNRSLREVPQDLNPFRGRLSSGLVHADEDGRVFG
jgi:hypothetical protein